MRCRWIVALVLCGMVFAPGAGPRLGQVFAETAADYNFIPPFVAAGEAPLVMLVMGRDHKLYYEAYNDASDLNEDNVLDVGYNPDIDYYGYFDCHTCYEYVGTAQKRTSSDTSISGYFSPVNHTEDKKCPGTGNNLWSGDFLNYLTMSRMDTLRKVLYGGYRSTDTADTVLERVFVPQDAHSWGKEYTSIEVDGYSISDYTPFNLPQTGTRHFFASTTLCTTCPPLMRIMLNNTHRIWEWVAKEQPVCDDSLEVAGGTYTGAPYDHDEFDDMVMQFAVPAHEQGSQNASQINGSDNPFGADDYFLTIFSGEIVVTTGGTYTFAVDGDDAVEFMIDGAPVAAWYGPHGKCSCKTHTGSITLSAGHHVIEYRHHEMTGDANYYLYWNGPDSGSSWQLVPSGHFSGLTQTVYDLQLPGSQITDYVVRVKVCDPAMPEENCKQYIDGTYKPTGILQRYGEPERMMFGLLTGSHQKNTSGGVLRKNCGSIADEINPNTGQFTAVNGIIKTIDKLHIVDYSYGSRSYDGGWMTTRAMNEGEFQMWGNPIGEMMYETLRYFAGEPATSDYYPSTDANETELGLPRLPGANWVDPYSVYSYCAQPFMLVLSDINPSFDSDQLPGSVFGSVSTSLGSLNVQTLSQTISANEPGVIGSHYIGRSVGNDPEFDTACTPKTVSGLGNINGLCPEEPTKKGGYYSAAVSYYGRKQDIRPTEPPDDPTYPTNVTTYTVGLASPLPRIEIPVGDQTITLVPFGKSVGESGNPWPNYQPTNTIVDFFVQEISPDGTYGKFRINYEDVEQGADHDMDAIVSYEYQVNPDNTVTITLEPLYASGSYVQHLGYIISGTTADGVYLEVTDSDSGGGNEVRYILDTPPGCGPHGSPTGCTYPFDGSIPNLPYQSGEQAIRTFTPGANPAATLLQNPLWYAAKWGGYEKADENDIPDVWDKDENGDPDNYYFVQNPLYLEESLNQAFLSILKRVSSGTAVSVISSTRSGEGAIYQAVFYPQNAGVSWTGDIHAFLVDGYGNIREDSNHNAMLDLVDDYIVVFSADADGNVTITKYQDANGNGQLDEDELDPPVMEDATLDDLEYLWSSQQWLASIPYSDVPAQRYYDPWSNGQPQRHIVTFVDHDNDMVVDSNELIPFTQDYLADILPYLNMYPPFEPYDDRPDWIKTVIDLQSSDPATYLEFVQKQGTRIINYTRGQDQDEYSEALYTIPAFRSRLGKDGFIRRLGDVVYSTPTVVGPPMENYDLIYKDQSYTEFYRKYKNRRQVVYVGGNDGMLHAFNAGFYDRELNKFWLDGWCWGSSPPSYTTCQGEVCSDGVDNQFCYTDYQGQALGGELWAYVPYNLLPHLQWLTDEEYNEEIHVSYVDLKPRVFDAKIFQEDPDHPGGWGTVLVGGMRFGGGKIRADWDKNNDYDPDIDRTMKSAYFILDITNPWYPPRVLAEITSDELGFTTCYPAIVTFKNHVTALDNNEWYLVFGSGPFDDGAIERGITEAVSTQSAKIVMLDLNSLGATVPAVRTVDSNGTLVDGITYFAELDANAFVSDPVSVDYDLDYKADAVYFGTVSGDFSTGWGGKLRRLIFPKVGSWINDSTLIDLTNVLPGPDQYGQPIVAAPSIAMSSGGQPWIFFGTGRFFNRLDATHDDTADDQQSYYGIKEFVDFGAGSYQNASRLYSDLADMTYYDVYEGDDINQIQTDNIASADGWRLDFDEPGERNIGQAVLLGDILTFTTYLPSADLCRFEGESYLYALYYGTGTAYSKSVIGLEGDAGGPTPPPGSPKKVLKKRSLGRGLTITPNVHTGRQKGSKVFIQTSTGAILGIDQQNPGVTKSGTLSWQEWLGQ